ncbi:contractile injection system tape measure protein [Zoogloea sp.]|uniref:contractile injection system tape measure protein n=1 Tax=Zoogloea sp. TaxID=49181 RepID=UPI002620392F|nr:contractile injection system tape measure protein [Zoogloea sp.]MDD3354215.1 contractile injection system tape measure protein [Zoogloea sp.]
MVVARTLAERMDSDPAALSQALNNALHGQSTPPPLTGQARILLVGQALDLPAAWLPPLIAQTRRRLGHPAAQPSHHSPPSLPADQDLQLQHSLARYLATGSVDWSLAGLPRKQVLAWLQDAAHLWTTLGVPPPLTGLSVRERTGAMARWLDLLDAPTQRTLLEAHPLPPSATPAETHLFALAQAGGSRSDTVAARALWLLWRGSAEVATGTPAPELAAWLTETAPCLPPALEASLKPHASGHQCFSSTGVTGNGTPQAFIPSPSTRPSPLLESPAPGVRVPHAGLVLLHPWLARLLNATGMHPLGQNGPLATHSLPGAATLLHWLATGQIDCHEFELPFVKLLLGHGPDEPLAFTPPALAPSQQMEGQALLEAALGHWKALGSTAIDSLRSAFLQRPGSLIQQDEAWQLRVDTESFDMLLGLLPWGFGLVRLPWMRTPLRVEWEPPR